ncbi:NAD-dependent epimerase/dehydratase family protein [Candidatus Uabimicrobium amorphum]|uniref:NAD dependent epimerase/dehydratase n=1 Tax=Uabimicrobium amorphum TaxID=2596890 RepID=A0A5S9IPW1_UABAM|nr:NAD-dependent epimerase/dehydratase family protein [Candidatus Uabimicrobium amorphum]BBM85517.1 NAD dependent epimerase/dehydratase [Candidatus Uabimicrobium amorphum]
MNILILGGNRFFGRKLAQLLVEDNHSVTLLNRGRVDDGLGDLVQRIVCDRTDYSAMKAALDGTCWDIVFDQVCYTHKDAKEATELFAGKVTKYIHTSTVSVYDYGVDLTEDKFNPQSYTFSKEIHDYMQNYKEAKRQAEVAFTKWASFPVTFVRIPVVIGSDDYTERFAFHLSRVRDGKEMYFPNLEARKSFITSDDAAKALYFLGKNDFSGAINVASPQPVSLKRLLEIIESKYNKKAVIAEKHHGDNHSPYGIEKDWFINVDVLKSLGLELVDIEKWLTEFTV